mgnify:FL=1
MNTKLTRRSKKKKSKFKKYILSFIAIVFVGIVAWGGMNYYSFQKALDKMNDSKDEQLKASAKEIDVEPFSVLLLGIDERANDNGRTDTMIVATVNPDLGTIKMLSIPRDSRVEIVGNNTVEKINHAYARGGVAMSIDTVENLLSIPIDYYVAVNMEGFLSVIDKVGGIEVMNDMDLAHGGYSFPQGEIKLSGEEALIFSRIRYEDPRGDFGRQMRQKLILEALLKEAKDPEIIFQLGDIMKVLGDNIRMNFTVSELKDFSSLYKKLNNEIDLMQFENGVGQTIGKYWYYILDEQEVSDISQELNTHLGNN